MAPKQVRTGIMAPGKSPDVDGATGDPSRATAEPGEIGMDCQVAAAMKQIRRLMAAE